MNNPPLLPQDLERARAQEMKAANRRGIIVCVMIWLLIAVIAAFLLFKFQDAFGLAQNEKSMAWGLAGAVLTLGFIPGIFSPLEYRRDSLQDTHRLWQSLSDNPVDCQTMVDILAQSSSARDYRDNVVQHRELHRCDLLYAQHLASLDARNAQVENDRRICQQAHGLHPIA